MATRLQCSAMNYAWGTPAPDSLVYRLAVAGAHLETDGSDGRPYAELWMGTHPNAPSRVIDGGPGDVMLCDVVGELPFLAKVLAVGKALSIQAHPDKARARELHGADPRSYPDANHKPEMAIALTRFEALYGFRPVAEIRAYVAAVPELQALVGDLVQDGGSREMLKCLVSRLLAVPDNEVKRQARALSARLAACSAADDSVSAASRLFVRIACDFPDDVGLFFVYLLNHVVLQPGEALFMEANRIHAYLAGDCVEVMANSDNVVRAGLTPKFKDAKTLVEMLEYECGEPDACMLRPVPHAKSAPSLPAGSAVSVYDPPIDEFTVHRVVANGNRTPIFAVDRPSIIIVVSKGGGTLQTVSQHEKHDVEINIGFGDVLLLEANSEGYVECSQDTGPLEIYQFF